MRIRIRNNKVVGGVLGGDLNHLRNKKGHMGHKIHINQHALTSSGSGLDGLEQKFTGLLRKNTKNLKFKFKL